MVKDGRDALLDAVDVERVGRGARARQRQLAIHGPPCPVEDFIEICRVVAHDGKAASQRGIDVCVRVDERRHDHAALGVDLLGLRVLRREIGLIADFDDLRALERDRTFFIVALAVRVARDDAAICE